MTVENCTIKTQKVFRYNTLIDDTSGEILVKGCEIFYTGSGVDSPVIEVDATVVNSGILHFVNNSIYRTDSGTGKASLANIEAGAKLELGILRNNIIECDLLLDMETSVAFSDLRILDSDVNLFKVGKFVEGDVDLDTLADWQGEYNQDENSLDLDPLFIDPTINLSVSFDSPAIANGRTVSEHDGDGVIRGLGRIDIGAFQNNDYGIGLCGVMDVLQTTGALPKDLDFEANDNAGFEALIEKWILEATSIINTYTNKVWTPETAPDGIVGICRRATSNMIELAIQRRKTGIVLVSDFTIKTLQDIIFTDDMNKTMDLYADKDVLSDSSRKTITMGVFVPGEEV